jgi:molybdopterin-guanine dinucleotide biosynthesis protein A
MATDKASLVWQGESLVARAARVLGEVCDPVIEVGSGATGLQCVREEPPGSGPLAALVAGARALQTRGPVVLLACDLPFVEPPVLRLIADWPGTVTVIPRVGAQLQFVCARYSPQALDRAANALDAGERSLRSVAELEFDELPEAHWRTVGAPNALADVDTPADLRRLGLS